MIEDRLVDASRGWFPSTPSLSERVVGRVPTRPDPRPAPRVAILVAVAVVVTGTAVAATLLDRVPGVRIHRVDRLPAVPVAQPLAAGRSVTLAEARRALPFAPLLLGGVEEPSRLYLDGGVLTVVYGGETRARLVLTQWVASAVLFEKLLDNPGVEPLEVGGALGEWIHGPEHEVFYLGRGQRAESRIGGRLAGNTLLWFRDGVSYRLEADVPLGRALELAASLRPA